MALEGESGVLTPEKSLCSHQLDQDFVREKLFMLEVRRDLNVDSCYVLTDTLETVEKDAKNTMKHLDEKLQKMREKLLSVDRSITRHKDLLKEIDQKAK